MAKDTGLIKAVAVGLCGGLVITGGCYLALNYDNIFNKEEVLKPAPTPDNPDEPDEPGIALTYEVKFIYDEEEIIQTVEAGGFAFPETLLTIEGVRFLGWYIDDLLIDVSTYPITQDTIFIAKFETAHDVIFNVDGVEAAEFVFNGEFASQESPTKVGYNFIGWSIDGVNVIDISTYQITENTTFIAIFEEKVADPSLFDFDGEKIVAYNGTEADIVLPSSYSLGEKVIETKIFTTYSEAFSFVNTNTKLLPCAFVDSGGTSYTINSVGDIYLNKDNMVFPVSASLEVQKYVQGNDFQVTSIGDSVFSSNKIISHVKISEGITTIGSSAFIACLNLKSVSIPESLTSIGENAFFSCYNLENIYVAENNTVYTDENGCNAIIEKSTNTLLWGCKNTIIPNSVTTIGYGAFSRNETIESIVIPANVKTIEDNVFVNCKSLKQITFLGAETIGDGVLTNCTNLETVILNEGLVSIGKDFIDGCTSLKSITYPSTLTSIGEYYSTNKKIEKVIFKSITPPTITKDILNTTCKIYVPDEALETYKTATYYSTHASQFYPLSELEEV